MNVSSLAVGQKIELNDGRLAQVRFVGTTHFQTGDWVGVQLEEATGKNDGSVKGERYFDCEQGYGMFLRPAGVRQVVEDAKPKARPGVAAKGRPASGTHSAVNGLKRQESGRRQSNVPASPTPGARACYYVEDEYSAYQEAGSRSDWYSCKDKDKHWPYDHPWCEQTDLHAASNNLYCGRERAEVLLGTSYARHEGSTEHSTGDDNDSERPSVRSPRETESPTPSPGEEGEQETEEPTKPNFAPPPIPSEPPQQTSRSRRPSSPTAASTHSGRTIRSTAASNRQIEELEAKVRLLERKRQEDRDVQKQLEQAHQERDQYKGIIEKLQTKVRPLQHENAELKQSLSETEARFADIEAIQAEHDSVMELATLDREVAEERAEGLQAELDALRAKNEEMELELEVLRDENGELSKEMSPEERTSAGWLQMEKSNERLREALLRLRDFTQDKETELKEQIQSLEDQVKEMDVVRNEYDETREKLLRSEADTNDLRQQLEAALESEEMIEELTERNGRLEAHLGQLRTTIEELEDLRELNDELEVNHIEQEKQLQEEIDFKDSILLDRERTAKQQQEALDEADYTITRYRGLVSQMQKDIADMQASKQLSETEAADLNSKSRAMLDLNMKLQTSASKTQVKTLDLELRKLEAQEASEHLAIVQLFLPEAFHAERDSVLALLRFKRIGFKAGLVQSFIKERVESFGTRGQDEDVFAACDVADKLTWIAGMSERFVNSICGCSIEDFAKYEGALYELEPVERALNAYIDGLRREEVREKGWAEELQRSIAVMSHLAEVHVKDDLPSQADALMMRTNCVQGLLESAASALGLMKGMIAKNVSADEDDDSDDDEGSASDLAIILNRAEALVSHSRNAKVMAGKTHRALMDLLQRSLTLDTSHTEAFDSVEGATESIAKYTRQAGEALQELFGEEGRNEPFTTDEVASALSRTATSTFSLPSSEAGPFSALANKLRSLTDMLADLAQLPTDLDNTVEFERAPAPWVARATELKQTKITNIDTEAELARTLEDLRAKDVAIREKETELEEQSVRIEMLEARMKDASKRSAKIAELERALHEAKEDEKQARAELSKARQDAENQVDRVREEMGRLAEESRKGGAGAGGNELDDGAMGAGTRSTMKRQEFQITSLEAAIRYLKEENHRLRLPPADSPLSMRSTLDWLHEPLLARPASASARRNKQAAVQKEGKDALQEMLRLAARPQTVDLTKLPENKLAWRPAKQTPRWNVERRKEEWAGMREWQREIVRKGGGGGKVKALNREVLREGQSGQA
ncbi:hypothetical protein KC332_g14884 [Hortaea werneckii]|uniref:CAP-Gly domain-containing protein n=1 Tax=Hortaea werneckii EXF-2000 TaxID=1157616 RepID=A0A1Z5T704_HORWE|nr:hypothetical protein KC350_g14497 [Hortaea werneckii]OTA31750.1 hypothetical protein BTJ68_08677 [Hortaea werneckii EXF-2000]KAI6843647.1 hypothetical protein KC358_g3821 [Hortaea werneckii]KAI6905900.1 hypothetical protein KC348_g14840 [Hortaea werneckii]KAI6942271.1 hypothetical protein KC341_g2366 [Hortaea werneckii]